MVSRNFIFYFSKLNKMILSSYLDTFLLIALQYRSFTTRYLQAQNRNHVYPASKPALQDLTLILAEWMSIPNPEFLLLTKGCFLLPMGILGVMHRASTLSPLLFLVSVTEQLDGMPITGSFLQLHFFHFHFLLQDLQYLLCSTLSVSFVVVHFQGSLLSLGSVNPDLPEELS